MEKHCATFLRMGDMFGVDQLKKDAGIFMKDALSTENMLETLLVAYHCHAPSLRSAVIEFVTKNEEAMEAAYESREDWKTALSGSEDHRDLLFHFHTIWCALACKKSKEYYN